MQECVVECQDISIVFQDGEGKSKMRFNNRKRERLKKVTVDGCVIKDGQRCDFLLVSESGCEHFIELKGKQVKYACEQIESSIKRISKDLKAAKYAFVVSSACPLTTTEIQVLKAKFKKNYNAVLKVKNRECCHDI
jgi:hypothetical protein